MVDPAQAQLGAAALRAARGWITSPAERRRLKAEAVAELVSIQHMYELQEGDDGYVALTGAQELHRQWHVELTCRKLQAHYPWLSWRLVCLMDEARGIDNSLRTCMACARAIDDLVAGPLFKGWPPFSRLMWAMTGALASSLATLATLRVLGLLE
jgi:hypothetical protein